MTNKLPKFEGMTDEDEAVLRGAIVRTNASESSGNNVTEYAVSKHSLETLANRIADLEAQNSLFRLLVDAWTFSDTPPTESDLKRMADAYAKIIEGGALK